MYYITCIAGTENIVSDFLLEDFKGLSVSKVMSGSLIIETNNDSLDFEKIPYINNAFRIIFKSNDTNINSFINKTASFKKSYGITPTRNKTYRVIVSRLNQLIKSDNRNIKTIQQRIEKESGMKLYPHKPDVEFWILKRSENVCFFMQRLFKHKSFDKTLDKGQLRADICYIMVRLSSPNATDIVLEPFFGSGALLISRIRYGGYKMIFANEIMEDKVNAVKAKYKNIRKKAIVKKADSLNMEFVKEGFIHKILADPPWGDYDNNMDVNDFYNKMFLEFARVLKSDGVIIMLTARKDEVEAIIHKSDILIVKDKYDILLSGKKAGLYKIIKQ